MMAFSSVAGILRGFRRTVSSSVLQCRSLSDAGLVCHMHSLKSSEALCSGGSLMDIPLSGEFPPAVQNTQTFGADTPAFDRNASVARRSNAYRVYQTDDDASGIVGQLRVANLEPQLTRTGSIKDETRVGDCTPASTNMAQESDDEECFRRRNVELAIGSADTRGHRHQPSAGITSDVIAFLKHRRQQGILQGIDVDAYSFIEILRRCSLQKDLTATRQVHDYIIQTGMQKHRYVATTLLNVYIKCGSLHDARRVFDGLGKSDRTVITWTVMIGAYAKSAFGVEAYRLFIQMRQEGFTPDAITYLSILNASATAGALERVKDIHSHALKMGLESDVRVASALVHMYAKCGSIDDSRLVFDRMENRNVITWNVMIGGLAEHGYGHEALEVFGKMNAVCVKPDETTFVAILSACSHAGLVDDGRRLFSAMTQDYDIERTVVHYNCMVDLLGRAGHLEEAKRLIDDMPLEPDAITWFALLGACRTYGSVQLGELAAEEVFKFKPNDASAYVLLSNIYAAAGMLEKVSSVRTMMEQRNVRKGPGRSWIEVDKKIHEFIVGDTSHPEARAIYTMLNKLTEKLKAEGYTPDTELVLQDIHEEDKELALCSHSEKLAIAYGLLRIPRGKPIRVYKNLRVCSDCHRATKFISKVTGREIIARDSNRFHHFKDGVCSCDDYW